MSNLTDRTITALRINRDDLADRVRTFTPADLDTISGSTQWDVAQVLSHLGSGAEIGLEQLRRQLAEEDPAGPDFNQGVWDRWNAMSQQAKADNFLNASEQLLAAYEGMDTDTRVSLRFNLGFLPAPVDLSVLTGMRLNEALLHAWDVRVAFDPDATIPGPLAAVLLEQFQGPVSFFMTFLGKTAGLNGARHQVLVVTEDPSLTLGLELAEAVRLIDAPQSADAELTIPTESLMRMLSGRLSPEHSPGSVTLESDQLTLDELRGVFPGF